MASFNYHSPAALTANGNTPGATIDGRYQLVASGAFGGGSLQPQLSHDDGATFVPFGSAITAGGASVIEGSGIIRFALTGATAPNVKVSLRQIRQDG